MPKSARTHDENRKSLCLFCFQKNTRCRKSPFVKILPGGKLEKTINSHFKYNANDKRLPNAICEQCRKKLYRVKNGSLASIISPNLKPFYEKKYYTRSSKKSENVPCDCKLCEIMKTPMIQHTGMKFVINRRKIQKPFQRCKSYLVQPDC